MPEVMAEQAKGLGYPILKIKPGSERNETMVKAIRKATDMKLRVDANAGWSREKALQLIPRLADYDLEFIEQPLDVYDVEGYFWLKERLNALRVNALVLQMRLQNNTR